MHKDNEIISHVPMSIGSYENVPLSNISLYIYIFVCGLLVIHLLRCLCFILIGSFFVAFSRVSVFIPLVT